VGEIVRQCPDWTFAFIGPDAHLALPDLVDLPNVLMLGVIPYRHALKAISRFDVGIIPFKSRPFTRGNSFMKLLDHLAHGTPVVATPLPDTVAVTRAAEDLVLPKDRTHGWPRSPRRSTSRRPPPCGKRGDTTPRGGASSDVSSEC